MINYIMIKSILQNITTLNDYIPNRSVKMYETKMIELQGEIDESTLYLAGALTGVARWIGHHSANHCYSWRLQHPSIRNR